MSTPLRVLIVEDSEDDTLLLVQELRREGYEPTFKRVETADAIAEALTDQPWDLVLCDYSLPQFNALAAIRVVHDSGLDLPIIVVSGTIGEETAVETMKAGAHDYIMKDNLARLVPAIGRELEEAEERRARRRAEEELREAHQELQQAYNNLEQAQASAIAAEKLAALGRLTAGVSHEVLNPLTVITLCLGRIIDAPDTPTAIARDLREMEEQANRIVKIAQDLLYFTRQRLPERRQVDFNEIVRRTLSLLDHDLRLQNIGVELNLATNLPPILADHDQLQQVVINLLTNARDAMPEGGRLYLQTSVVESVFVDQERTVELRIEDTGPGITPEHVDMLFDPFFTTKPEGQGTGLGLSICQGIVEAHGGAIWAENLPGEGAAFIVRLGMEGEQCQVRS